MNRRTESMVHCVRAVERGRVRLLYRPGIVGTVIIAVVIEIILSRHLEGDSRLWMEDRSVEMSVGV